MFTRPRRCPAVLVVLALAACTTASPRSDTAAPRPEASVPAVRHTAVPVGDVGEVLADHGLDYEVTSVVVGDDTSAVLRIGGHVLAEERWVDGRYYQRSAASALLLGDDRWLSADPGRESGLELGLRTLAAHGGRDEIEPGVVVELVAERTVLRHARAVMAPPAADVVAADDLDDVIAGDG